MEVKLVEVGLFKLPGLIIETDISNERLEEMRDWAKEHKTGREIDVDRKMWVFRNEKQRNFFIMRWS